MCVGEEVVNIYLIIQGEILMYLTCIFYFISFKLTLQVIVI